MGFSKEGRPRRVLRGVKTLFFLLSLLLSLLFFAAPVLLAVADSLLTWALLSASLSPSSLSLETISSHLRNYDFRNSLIDIPLISLIRSALILCVYGFCDGPSLSRGPYLGVATVCSVSSLVFVSSKASLIFGDYSRIDHEGFGRGTEVALFVCSLAFAIGHVVAAYRTSCRERRKLLVYKIDIEAVSACKNGFPIPRYQKLIQDGRVKQEKQEK
ncbi:hypothetical protein NMG60_11018393 [Bertholletia excelsa]